MDYKDVSAGEGSEPKPMAVRKSNRQKVEGGRRYRAGMQCSPSTGSGWQTDGKRVLQHNNSISAMGRNGMKRYGGCISPTERRKRACEDEDKATKRKLPFFWAAELQGAAVDCGMEPLQASDWNSRAEQRKRLERDRLIVFFECVKPIFTINKIILTPLSFASKYFWKILLENCT